MDVVSGAVPDLQELRTVFSVPEVGPVELLLLFDFDERGKLISRSGSTVTENGGSTDVSAKGTLKVKNGVALYKVSLKDSSGSVKAKIAGIVGDSQGLVSYKGSNGRFKGAAPVETVAPLVDLRIEPTQISVDEKGRVAGTVRVSSHLGTVDGVLKGKLKNGLLSWKVSAGKTKIQFKKGSSTADGYVGGLKWKAAPGKGAVGGFTSRLLNELP